MPTVNDKDCVGKILNDAIDAVEVNSVGGDTPQEGMSPPSKRRKHHSEGGGSVDGDLVKSSLLNNDEVAATGDLDDRKPAAKQAVAGDLKSEPSDNDSLLELELAPDDDPRKLSKRKRNDINGNNELPLAPSLDEYLKSGGHIKYTPRPEWYHFSNEAAVSVAMQFMESTGAPSAVSERLLAGRMGIARGDLVGVGGGVGGKNPVEIHEDINNNEGEQVNIPPAARVEIRRNSHEQMFPPAAPALAAARVEIRRNSHEHHPMNHPPLAVPAIDGSMPPTNNMAIRQMGVALGHHPLQHLGQHPLQLGEDHHRHNRHHHYYRVRNGRFQMDGPRHAEEGPSDQPLDHSVAAVVRRRQELEAIPVANPAGVVDPAVANNALLALFSGRQGQQQPQEGSAGDPSLARGRQIEAGENNVDESIARGRGSMEGAQQDNTQQGPSESPTSKPYPSSGSKVAVFGSECDSALHLAIKQHATEAAMDLIRAGACINFSNAKGITPLMVASQEGTLEVVRAILNEGALPNATTVRGSTALIQACHFGKLPVVEELMRHGALVDQANLKNTTALMRASQEGHESVVRLLLSRNAGVNRRNDERMTALMLSSQRGHASIVKMLVTGGAQVDAKTAQDSTSLMLACKRKHINVAKILVASGTELKLKDCKNRSVLETATRRGNDELSKILTDSAQVTLMQEDSRCSRNFSMVRLWKLLQSERAMIRLGAMDVAIHTVAETMDTPILRHICPSKRALVRAMTLPAPLIELISSFIPLPLIWEKRLMLLTSRSHVDPDSAVYNALDLIDEVLEVGGIIEAFDAVGVTPPSSFASWSAYRAWCGKCDVILSRCADIDVTNLFAQESDAGIEILESNGTSPKNLRHVESSQTQRRSCNYLQVLARAPQSLTSLISSHPYDMPCGLLEKLKSCHDIQSLTRRLSGGGIHFDTAIANEMVVMGRMAVMWCESRSMY